MPALVLVRGDRDPTRRARRRRRGACLRTPGSRAPPGARGCSGARSCARSGRRRGNRACRGAFSSPKTVTVTEPSRLWRRYSSLNSTPYVSALAWEPHRRGLVGQVHLDEALALVRIYPRARQRASPTHHPTTRAPQRIQRPATPGWKSCGYPLPIFPPEDEIARGWFRQPGTDGRQSLALRLFQDEPSSAQGEWAPRRISG